MKIELEPIGTIHTPFAEPREMPIQPIGAEGIKGSIEIFPRFAEGLGDLDGFSHIILLYHLHKVAVTKLVVTPFMDDTPRGVFATRAPSRPNHIGLSVVRLTAVEGNRIHIENVDIVDGTPLLDIKPYVYDLDCVKSEKSGWLTDKAVKARKHRFAEQRFK